MFNEIIRRRMGEKNPFFLLYFIALLAFILLPRQPPSDDVSPHIKLNQNVMPFCRSHYFVNFCTPKVNESTTQQYM